MKINDLKYIISELSLLKSTYQVQDFAPLDETFKMGVILGISLSSARVTQIMTKFLEGGEADG